MITLCTLSNSILWFFQVRIPCLYALSLHGHLQGRTLDAIITRKDLPMPDMCCITWRVLRPFLVNFTISASATARLLHLRQYACLKGLQRTTASAESFWPAVFACHRRHMLAYRSTNCKNDTTPRYAPSWKNTLCAELHVTVVSWLHPVRWRLCQGLASNKGFWTVVSEDEAGFWSVGLDWASQEETTTALRQTNSVLG